MANTEINFKKLALSVVIQKLSINRRRNENYEAVG